MLTGLCLGCTLSFPFWYGLGLYYVPANTRERLAGIISLDNIVQIWLVTILLGGLTWGLALNRLSGLSIWRLCLAGGFGALLGGVVATSTPFPHLFNVLWPQAPIHIRWIMTLVLGIGLGGGILALAVGLALRWGYSILKFTLSVFFAASLPALIVALTLDMFGIRWGMGNANMAKIAGLAFPAATLSAGAVIGWYLARYQHQGG
jgi:hypothetical protein